MKVDCGLVPGAKVVPNFEDIDTGGGKESGKVLCNPKLK